MANFGLSRPWIASLDVRTGKYTNAFRFGKAVTTSVTPAYNEASLYADNIEAENVKEFKNAAVAVGVDHIPVNAAKVVFGHEVDNDGSVISRAGDEGGYVGYGFITAELQDGIKKFQACFLPKVKFSEGEESFETKGDNVVFKTPTLNGTAIGNTNTDWRIKSPQYDTEQEAEDWIKIKVGVKEKCETPIASVKGGTYSESKTISLSTATQGASIIYTTNGTTPSLENGTLYSEPIRVEETTGLRAIAYKDGAVLSELMVEEFYISGQATEEYGVGV